MRFLVSGLAAILLLAGCTAPETPAPSVSPASTVAQPSPSKTDPSIAQLARAEAFLDEQVEDLNAHVSLSSVDGRFSTKTFTPDSDDTKLAVIANCPIDAPQLATVALHLSEDEFVTMQLTCAAGEDHASTITPEQFFAGEPVTVDISDPERVCLRVVGLRN